MHSMLGSTFQMAATNNQKGLAIDVTKAGLSQLEFPLLKQILGGEFEANY